MGANMRAEKLQTKSVQVMTAVARPETGPAGIGVVAINAPTEALSNIYEQALGNADDLQLRAVLRALQLGKQLHASNISILCPDEYVVKLVNREVALEPGSPLAVPYIKVRALMHTYQLAEVLAVPRSRVEPARRLAIEASRMPVHTKQIQKSLFANAA